MTMTLHSRLSALGIFTILSGCASNTQPTPKLHHALLTAPNSQAASRVIERLMHIKNIKLADDVFMHSSTFTLKNTNRSDITANQQRNFPDQFELMINNNRCYIRHLDSKATAEINSVTCSINPSN
ncbi:hypothetical protein AN389_01887 [Pseudoalteromonas sp. P1-7a]|nr:hypothetical protein AN389_01887 [Pseudoalteromonas sp. P1-7a]